VNSETVRTRRRWEKPQTKIIQEYITSKLSSFDLSKEAIPRVKWTEDELQGIAARIGASPNLKPKLNQELKVIIVKLFHLITSIRYNGIFFFFFVQTTKCRSA
jgi:hypothetical protein